MRKKLLLPLTVLVSCLLAGLLSGGPAGAAERPGSERSSGSTGSTRSSEGQAAAERRTAADETVVMNGPVFNDPADGPAGGTPTAAQRAVFDQLLGLIAAVPPGEQIRLSMFEWAPGASTLPQQVVQRLIDAYERGVHVRIVLNTSDKNQPVRDELDAALGHDESAASWVVGCGDYSSTARGCLARNYSHEKFALFSRVEWADGTSTEDVVHQSSSNLTDWYLFNSYNDAFTFSDGQVYAGYVTHFDDLREGRHHSVNPDYFWATPTGTPYKALFYPRDRATGDPIVNVLRGVGCSYQEPDGSKHQTDIRIVISAFTKNRVAIAHELIRLRGENCWIDVIYGEGRIEDAVLNVLDNTASNGKKLQLLSCRYDAPAGQAVTPHNKVLMTDGAYSGDIVPRVYTGSANFTTLENSDDSQLRLKGRAVHDQYLSWFYDLRAACR